MSEIRRFYKTLFTRKSTKTEGECLEFLTNVPLPSITEEQNNELNKPITKEELKLALKNSKNGKSPGTDGLPREFYVIFWNEIEDLLYNSLNEAKTIGSLFPSQRQAIIKLLDKGKDKRYIKNF